MSTVCRFDLVRFTPKTQLTPQGFLRAPAHLTRAGVFVYTRSDGTTVRELRPESEVFHADSLASIVSAPVVIDHPAEYWVTPKNASRLAKGWAEGPGIRTDSHVAGTLVIMDASTMDRVSGDKADLKEISMGYSCRIDKTSGTDPRYGDYDQIQRDIRYNHIALGPVGWGRAGSDIGLRLDANAALMVSALDTLTTSQASKDTDQVQEKTSRIDHRGQDMNEKIIIAGVEFEVPKSAAQAMAAEMARMDSKLKELESLQGRFDAQAEKLASAEKALDEAKKEAGDQARFDSAVQARVALIDQAKSVLGADSEIKGSNREVKEAVLRHDAKDASFEGKSDDYVDARFDYFMEHFAKEQSETSMRTVRQDAHNAQTKPTEKRIDSNRSRQEMIERNRKAATEPLTVSRKD